MLPTSLFERLRATASLDSIFSLRHAFSLRALHTAVRRPRYVSPTLVEEFIACGGDLKLLQSLQSKPETDDELHVPASLENQFFFRLLLKNPKAILDSVPHDQVRDPDYKPLSHNDVSIQPLLPIGVDAVSKTVYLQASDAAKKDAFAYLLTPRDFMENHQSMRVWRQGATMYMLPNSTPKSIEAVTALVNANALESQGNRALDIRRDDPLCDDLESLALQDYTVRTGETPDVSSYQLAELVEMELLRGPAVHEPRYYVDAIRAGSLPAHPQVLDLVLYLEANAGKFEVWMGG